MIHDDNPVALMKTHKLVLIINDLINNMTLKITISKAIRCDLNMNCAKFGLGRRIFQIVKNLPPAFETCPRDHIIRKYLLIYKSVLQASFDAF